MSFATLIVQNYAVKCMYWLKMGTKLEFGNLKKTHRCYDNLPNDDLPNVNWAKMLWTK